VKVLITTDLFRSTINGVVTSVLNLERELKEQGHEVRILTVSDTGKAYQEGNVWYLRSVPSGIYPGVRIPVSRGKEYVRELIAWKPDVVHSQCEFCTFGYGRRIARETGAAFVHTFHTLYEQYTKYIPIGKHLGAAALAGWMRYRLRAADVCIAPTEKVERTLLGYGIENSIAVIPTGIRLERFGRTADQEERERFRSEWGIAPGAKVVLSLGRLGFEKRIDELLRGWKQADIPKEQAVLLVAGGGPARESLERWAQELGLAEQVKFCGMIEPSGTPAFYQMADLFVCASTSETQGLTYAEALASGLPLLCRADSCLKGVLEPGANGYAYEEVDDFVNYLKELLGRPDLKSTMGAHSRKLSQAFGTKAFGEAVLKLYRKETRKKEAWRNESSAVYQKSEASFQEWNWAGYANAKRLP